MVGQSSGMVSVINCQWDIKFIKPIFHIIEAKGPILLGLTTLRKMGFQKHPRVFIECVNIHQIQKDNLVRYVKGGGMSNKNTNGQSSVSDAE